MQPYQARVDAEGETALVFFGGVYSHSFAKGALLTGRDAGGRGPHPSEKVGVPHPPPGCAALAEQALDTAVAHLGLRRSDLLYARVDVVRTDDGTPALLELELTEPSLGLAHADPAAPPRFASAISTHLT